MIWTHESRAQEDQFYEKKLRPKISWHYPFKLDTWCMALFPGISSSVPGTYNSGPGSCYSTPGFR
jgi:hypothetical protein